MRTWARKFLSGTPLLGAIATGRRDRDDEMARLRAEVDALRKQTAALHHPPGHFYSPLLSAEQQRAYRAPAPVPRTLPGIDLNEAGQLALLRELTRYYPDQPFQDHPGGGLRFGFRNSYYSYGDAIFLHCMMRHFRPGRIVEVGSGFSSCAMLDTNDRFLHLPAHLTCIEPNPERLLSLLKPEDRDRLELIQRPVQEVGTAPFRELSSGDILFVDSSHVAKPGSDVAFLFSEVLPALASGVLIHFHDIFYPFEYPAAWIQQGTCWNEAYLMRAFLQYNRRFRIELFSLFLCAFHEPWFQEHMPLVLKDTGSSFWLRVQYGEAAGAGWL